MRLYLMINVGVIIPTLNAGDRLEKLLESINIQDIELKRRLIIDSSSNDQTITISRKFGWDIVTINREDFNHGSTRQLGVEVIPECEIVVFLTQDSILHSPDALRILVDSFKNCNVGAVYGRQIPNPDATALAAHARLFNYPPQSVMKSQEDAERLGIKAAFISNSFAAYRREALLSVGGFPSNTILGEDTYIAAKMLLDKWKIFYCAEAQVYHSHNYSVLEEFKRYFDIGVFHSRENWLIEKFGKVEGEGVRYVLSELQYVRKIQRCYLFPEIICRTIVKYLGYKLGLKEKMIAENIKPSISMHRRFWNK